MLLLELQKVTDRKTRLTSAYHDDVVALPGSCIVVIFGS